MNSGNLFDLAYADCLSEIMNTAPTTNTRTGKRVRARPGIALHLSPAQLPLLNLRDIKPYWTCAEVVWFLSGSKDAAWMSSFGFNVWDKFADPEGRVWSATGYRWREHFGVDQVKEIVNKLVADPSSRQCVLLSWDPASDLVNPGPNAPCLVTWHLQVLNGELFMTVMQRSADMFFGLPHDILGMKLVQTLIAARLGVRSGGMLYVVCNAHLYEDQWDAAEQMMARAQELKPSNCKGVWDPELWEPDITADHFARAMVGDKSLVEDLKYIVLKDYNPWPPIAGPKLVL